METPWRIHPHLVGRFTEKGYPDDLQVLIHDGHPGICGIAFEVIWVTVTGMTILPPVTKSKLLGLIKSKDLIPSRTIFTGKACNAPNHLKTVKIGQSIQFAVAAGVEYPILMTPKYLQERVEWIILPCDACGLSELYDAPSDLIKYYWPTQIELPAQFKSFCPKHLGHGGMQTVQHISYDADKPIPGLPLVPDSSKARAMEPKRFKSTIDGKLISLPNNCTGCGVYFYDLPNGTEITDMTFMGKGNERTYGSYCQACYKKLQEGRLKKPENTELNSK